MRELIWINYSRCRLLYKFRGRTDVSFDVIPAYAGIQQTTGSQHLDSGFSLRSARKDEQIRKGVCIVQTDTTFILGIGDTLLSDEGVGIRTWLFAGMADRLSVY